ncbi:DNA-binding MarR family transcriptional regulator [Streptosporangium album]|uniref:DNA-binding MarR family transcriptional regulator n=1 Tax=Streptosporangium album TaxID=47479 RepID=A0A7W7WE40_9ACTN|nr:MarR family transcriptional regulator [Streptosporangium album]MBB4943050.1 DNA-binding MarR family transcriptional regulator [Streptosporangium album]
MEEPKLGNAVAQHHRLMEGLRVYGANYTEFTRRFAAWLGVHSTDAAALMEVFYAEDRGTPLSPARLSERISLSSSATTALLNRLEQAGHIVRTREHADRRIVTLRSSPRIQEPAREFFGPLSDRMGAAMSQYPPELLQQFESFLDHLCTAMNAQPVQQNQTPD